MFIAGLFEYSLKTTTCDLVPLPTSRIVVKKLKFIFA